MEISPSCLVLCGESGARGPAGGDIGPEEL